MTKMINCDCPSDYQDKRYGVGRRVANMTENGDARCTVCNKTKGSVAQSKMVKK